MHNDQESLPPSTVETFLRLGPDVQVSLDGDPGQDPMVEITAGNTSHVIGLAGDVVTPAHVEAAGKVAEAMATFHARLKKMAEEQETNR